MTSQSSSAGHDQPVRYMSNPTIPLCLIDHTMPHQIDVSDIR